ncbi:unnamed protein product [Meloidogyne enterolobii]|uniref:Uncharacterized protein n=1 Tax=Meloidogyne enterolobii TaxID=390850 RepID=A0ACB1AW06_MELEN
MEGDPNYCYLLNNTYGFDIFLSRWYNNTTEHKRELNSRLVQNYLYGKNFTQNLPDIMMKVYNADNLTVVADAIKKEKPGIISPQHFRCGLILRTFASWPLISCPEIIYRKSNYGRGLLDASPVFSYRKSGGITHVCEDYRFIFFI